MLSSFSGGLSRTLRVFALSGAALLLMSGSTLAAQQISQTGTIGDAFFTDTMNHPGATCSYQGAAGTMYFSGVTVKGPKLQWPDQNVNVAEHGWVAYRIQIQHFDGTNWTVIKQSSPTKLKVYDNVTTKFPAKTLTWSTPVNHSYRAGVSLKWIKTDGSTWGRSTYYLEFHRLGFDNTVSSTCVGRHSNQL